MNVGNCVSQLMLERYSRGKVSDNERKFVEAALETDTELRLFYEELKKSDEEIRLLYPLENLPQLAAINDTVVPIPVIESSSESSSHKGFRRRWYSAKIVKWGLGTAAALVCVFFSVFYFTKWRSPNSPEQFLLTTIASLQPPGLSYDDSISNYMGFFPEWPQGVEGQVAPAYRDMSSFYGNITQEYFNTSEFDHLTDNPFMRVIDNPLSTFSIDVDTAGYSIARNYLMSGQMPPKSAVRIEELINYFEYDYPLL